MTLTKEQIEAMEPGRESDELVTSSILYAHWATEQRRLQTVAAIHSGFTPSRAIAHAWHLIAKLSDYDVAVEKCTLIAPESPDWSCSFYGLGPDGQILPDPIVEAWGSTAPMAICKASLLLKLEEEGNNA